METQIRNVFGGLKLQAILLLLIGIALPLIEIIIANYLERRFKRSTMPDTEGINSEGDKMIHDSKKM